jgi:transcriptional regulator with XRE-family HTH domain
MSEPEAMQVVLPDLRTFRESLDPRRTLGQVARGVQVDKSHLSRIEIGKREISAYLARALAQFYSQVAGRSVTVGEIMDMAERSAARRAGLKGCSRIRSSGAMEAPEV